MVQISRWTKNLVTSPINLVSRAIDRPLKPRWITYEMTDVCNSRCSHCNIWCTKPTSPKDHLNAADVERIFSDPLYENLEEINITGGEAVLKPDIIEILLAIHKVKPKTRIWISTNGLASKRVLEVSEALLSKGVEIGIGISLDGIGKHHDNIRGVNGNFQKVEFLLDELSKLKTRYPGKLFDITLGFTLSDKTVDYFEEVKEYAEKRCVSFLAQVYEEGPYYSNKNTVLIPKETEKREKMIKLMKSLPYTAHYETCISALEGKNTKFPCFAMTTFHVLRCNGDVVPCLKLSDKCAGNIKNDSPSKVWNAQEAKNVRKIVKNCKGCLNSWGTGWSYQSYWLLFLISHPKEIERLSKTAFKFLVNTNKVRK